LTCQTVAVNRICRRISTVPIIVINATLRSKGDRHRRRYLSHPCCVLYILMADEIRGGRLFDLTEIRKSLAYKRYFSRRQSVSDHFWHTILICIPFRSPHHHRSRTTRLTWAPWYLGWNQGVTWRRHCAAPYRYFDDGTVFHRALINRAHQIMTLPTT